MQQQRISAPILASLQTHFLADQVISAYAKLPMPPPVGSTWLLVMALISWGTIEAWRRGLVPVDLGTVFAWVP